MDELLRILIPIGMVLFWIYKTVRGDQEEDYTPPSQPAEDARTREIQEEIRRKIAERRNQNGGGGAPPPPLPQRQVPPPTPARSVPPPMPTSRHQRPVPQASSYPQTNYEEELQRQRQAAQEARLRAEKMKLEALQRMTASRSKAQPQTSKSTGQVPVADSSVAEPREFVRSMLKDARAARNAYVLQEVLGTPVSLRNDHYSSRGSHL